MSGVTHIQETLRWSRDEPIDWASVAACGIGMAAPLALAARNGHLSLGLAGAVGSLLMGMSSGGRTIPDLAINEAKALATLLAACLMVAVISEHGIWSHIALVIVAGIAVTIGGYSRQMSITTGRFVIFTCITFSAANGHAGGLSVFPLIGLSALVTSALIVAFGAVTRSIRPPIELVPARNVQIPTHAEMTYKWLKSLFGIKGWQFTIRIVICLGVAVTIAEIWPQHRYFWVAVTVVLVCQRPLDLWPPRTTQRAVGTLIGVVFAGLALNQPMPAWALVSLLGVLSAIRLGLRARNYLVFSAFMTPVIMLILDAGRPVDEGLLIDRLVATMVGAGLVISVNWCVARLVGK